MSGMEGLYGLSISGHQDSAALAGAALLTVDSSEFLVGAVLQ